MEPDRERPAYEFGLAVQMLLRSWGVPRPIRLLLLGPFLLIMTLVYFFLIVPVRIFRRVTNL